MLWQQVESLARNNPEWSKVVGQFSNMNLAVKRDDEFSQLPDNDLSYERLVQESGEVSNISNFILGKYFLFHFFYRKKFSKRKLAFIAQILTSGNSFL